MGISGRGGHGPRGSDAPSRPLPADLGDRVCPGLLSTCPSARSTHDTWGHKLLETTPPVQAFRVKGPPRGRAKPTQGGTDLSRARMSTCSITSALPPPGASRTLMGLGTRTVSVLRMAVRLAISPSNILLAFPKNNGGESQGSKVTPRNGLRRLLKRGDIKPRPPCRRRPLCPLPSRVGARGWHSLCPGPCPALSGAAQGLERATQRLVPATATPPSQGRAAQRPTPSSPQSWLPQAAEPSLPLVSVPTPQDPSPGQVPAWNTPRACNLCDGPHRVTATAALVCPGVHTPAGTEAPCLQPRPCSWGGTPACSPDPTLAKSGPSSLCLKFQRNSFQLLKSPPPPQAPAPSKGGFLLFVFHSKHYRDVSRIGTGCGLHPGPRGPRPSAGAAAQLPGPAAPSPATSSCPAGRRPTIRTDSRARGKSLRPRAGTRGGSTDLMGCLTSN